MTRIAHNKLTTEQWIKRAKQKHGDRYEYSESVYVNSATTIKVTCREHGEFMTWPTNHANKGKGCPDCSGNRRKTKKQFIAEAVKVHGSKYDYSCTEYMGTNSKLSIVCKDHGIFELTPYNHVHKGTGCPKCSPLYSPTTKEWIAIARGVHGERYGYGKVKYTNQSTKVIINCSKHGDWETLPSSHVLKGARCPSCALVTRGLKRRLSHEAFVNKAKSVHGNLYDYSNVKYTTSCSSIWVVCPEHGDFRISPANHLQGRGCPDCTTDFSGPTKVYLVEMSIGSEVFLKIGVTCRSIKQRFSIEIANGFTVKTKRLHTCATRSEALYMEKELHSLLSEFKHTPINRFHGETECFGVKHLKVVTSEFDLFKKVLV